MFEEVIPFTTAASQSGWVQQVAFGYNDGVSGIAIQFKKATCFYPGTDENDYLGVVSSGGDYVHSSGLYNARYVKI